MEISLKGCLLKGVLLFVLLIIGSLLLFSIWPEPNKIENQPDYSLMEEFGIDSSEIVYQYYQEFGFTDVCEDLRLISKQPIASGLQNNLPLTQKDLAVINSFPNKRDSLQDRIIIGNSAARSAQQDIESRFLEYIQDSSLVFQLKEGEYEIIQTDTSSILKIFDSINKLLYIEVHRCNGF
jgi:hypothetical protein